MNIKAEKIVFYDGNCGFCNRTVGIVLRYDKTKSIHFTSIQSEFSRTLFEVNKWPTPDLSTFYYFEKGKLYQKSKAALKVARNFSFPLSLLQLFWVFPRYISDCIYDFIAKRRKRVLKGYCIVPSQEEKELFID